ncbi:hypothetical protein [Dactylosporangium sp. NPDC051541]|uniref:hypothetical protein n=1 Tax=Dactylosporangium sp. NPDC051541 TaxID=3363977 RepID=UPI0037B56791
MPDDDRAAAAVNEDSSLIADEEIRSLFAQLVPQGEALVLDAGTLQICDAVDKAGDPVLVLKDLESTVVIEYGGDGQWDFAIQSAEWLSRAALGYAGLLRAARDAGREKDASNT